MKVLKKKFAGFTLLEILVALSIFSLLAAITSTVLYRVFNAKERTEAHAKRLSEIQLAFTLIHQDIQQIVYPPNGMPDTLSFIRVANTNPLSHAKRSQLSDISYVHNRSKLIRIKRGYLSLKPKDSNETAELLTQVADFQISYIDTHHRSVSSWKQANFPLAIRLTLQLNDLGEISEIYSLPQSLQVNVPFK